MTADTLTPTAPETEQQSHSQAFGENEHLYVPIPEAGEVTHMHLYAPDPEGNMVLAWKGQNMGELADEFLRLRTEVAALRASEARMREIVDYVLQDPICNRLVPRVVDIAYSAFMAAKRPNTEDGGPSDWFTDTQPMVMEKIAEIRSAALQGETK